MFNDSLELTQNNELLINMTLSNQQIKIITKFAISTGIK